MIDRRTLLAATAALPIAGCASRAAPRGRMLRVVTFNIWHDAGDWPTRRRLIADVLREADADVIALQEVLQDARKGLPNQATTIAGDLGGYAVHFTSADALDAPKRYGNAILSRLSVLAVAERKLLPLNDYRTALRVRVDVGGRAVDVAATHLANQPEAGAVRAQQVADLLGWLPDDGTPRVVLGDFNAPLDDVGLAALGSLRSALLPGSAATTLVATRGHAPRVIDHIFVEPRLAVTDARVIADRPVGGEYPSDHYGVAATLRLG